MSFLWDFLLRQPWEAGGAGETVRKQFCLQRPSFWACFFFPPRNFTIEFGKRILCTSSFSHPVLLLGYQGEAGAMLVILSAFCSPWLVVGSSGRKKKPLVVWGLLQERICTSICSCYRSANKRWEEKALHKGENSLRALSYPALMVAQNTYWEARWPIKKNKTHFSYAWK